MTLWKISLNNIKTKPLYTFLSVFILALSIGLLLAVQQLKASFQYQMENNLADIDLVIGAKGSPLQLVLSSVLHLDNPTGNISYKEAKKIGSNGLVERAVPISYGDNYKGFKIVGTTNDFATIYKAELREGRLVENSMEVVLGYAVAEQLQLKVGDTFLSAHGLVENDIEVHDDKMVIVGIYQPTQKVIDRLIVTNLESIWDVHDHKDESHVDQVEHEHTEQDDHDAHKEDAHDDKEITSLLVSFKNTMALLTLPRVINTTTNMQAALPKYELDKLYEYTGVGFKTVSWIAYIILVISGLIIFISLYKIVKERSFDLALLRTYGANNMQLIKIIAYEGLMVVFLALILGFVMAKGGISLMTNNLEVANNHQIVQGLPYQEFLQIALIVFVMIVLSITLAIYPILRMNISTILSNEK